MAREQVVVSSTVETVTVASSNDTVQVNAGETVTVTSPGPQGATGATGAIGPAGGDGGTWFSVVDYGADPTGLTDSTTAIQTAIDAAATAGNSGANGYRGGVVYFPRGTYRHTGLDLDDTTSLRLQGESGPTGGQNDRPATRLLHTGTGATSALSCKSAQGMVIDGLSIQYTSSSFAGYLVDFSHSAGGTDASRCVVQNCNLGPEGSGFASAKACIYLENAIIITIDKCRIGGAQRGIEGRESAGSYCNSVNVLNCEFNHCTEGFISNPAERWLIQGCTFEFLNVLGLSTSCPYGLFWDVASTSDVQWVSNWVGDLGLDYIATIYVPTTATGVQLTCWGATFYGGGGAVGAGIKHLGAGDLAAVGCIFATSDPGDSCGIDLGDYTVNRKNHVTIIGNTFTGPGDPIINKAGHYRRVIFGNTQPSGTHDDEFMFLGHLSTGNNSFRTANPSIAAGAAAGTAPTVSVSGNDMAGFVSVTAGTSPGTGSVCEVTYGVEYESEGQAQSNPKVMLTPCDANSAALAWYEQDAASTRTKFRIATATALSAGQTYTWKYLVVF